MSDLISNKKSEPTLFQILLLDNGKSKDIEVQETKQVDFFKVKKHLKNGGSVFITSKNSQKIVYPKTKAQLNYSKSRRNYGALFQKHLRRS